MSIVEVAKLAGVSQATVSRVINNRSNVSPASIERVEAAIQKLHYVPPAKRRGPKPKASGIRTGNVGVLFVGEAPTLVTSPVTARVVHAIQDEATANGLTLMLNQVPAGGPLPASLARGQVDGLLMHGDPPSSALRKQLSRYPSCVWLLSPRRSRGYWGDRVGPDNDHIGGLAARYLVDKGHRRLAVVHCDPSHPGFCARVDSFLSAAAEANASAIMLEHPDGSSLHSSGDPDEEARLDEVIGQLVACDDKPTGLFVPRDALTIRFYRLLRRRGIKPGKDLDIVSCDNIPALDALDPKPATIDLRPVEIGRRAVEQLLWQIHSRRQSMNVMATVKPELVYGDE